MHLSAADYSTICIGLVTVIGAVAGVVRWMTTSMEKKIESHVGKTVDQNVQILAKVDHQANKVEQLVDQNKNTEVAIGKIQTELVNLGKRMDRYEDRLDKHFDRSSNPDTVPIPAQVLQIVPQTATQHNDQ